MDRRRAAAAGGRLAGGADRDRALLGRNSRIRRPQPASAWCCRRAAATDTPSPRQPAHRPRHQPSRRRLARHRPHQPATLRPGPHAASATPTPQPPRVSAVPAEGWGVIVQPNTLFAFVRANNTVTVDELVAANCLRRWPSGRRCSTARRRRAASPQRRPHPAARRIARPTAVYDQCRPAGGASRSRTRSTRLKLFTGAIWPHRAFARYRRRAPARHSPSGFLRRLYRPERHSRRIPQSAAGRLRRTSQHEYAIPFAKGTSFYQALIIAPSSSAKPRPENGNRRQCLPPARDGSGWRLPSRCSMPGRPATMAAHHLCHCRGRLPYSTLPAPVFPGPISADLSAIAGTVYSPATNYYITRPVRRARRVFAETYEEHPPTSTVVVLFARPVAPHTRRQPVGSTGFIISGAVVSAAGFRPHWSPRHAAPPRLPASFGNARIPAFRNEILVGRASLACSSANSELS